VDHTARDNETHNRQQPLRIAGSGDTLIAWKLNRLGRDLRHLVSLMQELTGRGVGLRMPAGEGGLCWKLGDAVIRRRSVLTCW